MRIRSLFASLSFTLIAFASLSSLPAAAQFVYVGEFGGVLHRFNTDGTPNPPGNFINGASVQQVEGIEGLGSNLVFAAVVNGQRGVHYFSKATGAYLSTPVLAPGNPIFDMKIAPDAQSVYLAQTGQIRQFNLTTGAFLTQINRPTTSWGIAIHPITGEIYHTLGWDSNSHAARGVYRTQSNLTGLENILTIGMGNLNGLTAPAGLTFLPNGDLFVVNGGNGDPTNGFVNRYTYDVNTDSYTFFQTLDSPNPNDPAFRNGFDIEVGPDGNIYATNEDGACVVKFDLANGNAFSTFIPPNAGGLPAAKTIHFDVNSVAGVPEPGSIALLGGLVTIGSLMLRRRKRA
jgi:hypothetical protein